MTTGRPRRRRVLVALDAGPDYLEPLARAAELAHEMEAELSALFIEDANLFRLVGLPAAEIALGSGARRPLEARTLERELRARAAEARASLEEIARARQLSWSFQVYPVASIDQGIELLTGVRAGNRRKDGTYGPGTVNRLVQDRLLDFAEKRRSFGRRADGANDRNKAEKAGDTEEKAE